MSTKEEPAVQESKSAVVECPICVSEIVVSSPQEQDHEEWVVCDTCKNRCCRTCFQRFLLSNDDLLPKCMFPSCKRQLAFEDIVLGTSYDFLHGAYKAHRASLLVKAESTRMEETQQTTRAYLTAQTVLAQQSYALARDDVLTNALACVEKFGCGWEDFDFGSQKGERPPTATKSVMRCPVRNCAGFVYASLAASASTAAGTGGHAGSLVCNLCSCPVCADCHEICRSEHKCDSRIVASIKAVYAEAKPCPKCGALISKIEGCDQMFCTQCHTTYSWLTGNIILGQVHNPHYFQWLFQVRNHGPLQRLVPTVPSCEEFITFAKLRSCFDARDLAAAQAARARLPALDDIWQPLQSRAHYYVAFENLRQKIIHVRATSGNHANSQLNDNRDLRVRLQAVEIDDAQFRDLVVSRDFEYRRLSCYRDVYLTVYELALVIFDNLYAFTRERDKIPSAILRRRRSYDGFLFETYTQLLHALHAANECLVRFDQIFGLDARLNRFSCHPYSGIVKPQNADQENKN